MPVLLPCPGKVPDAGPGQDQVTKTEATVGMRAAQVNLIQPPTSIQTLPFKEMAAYAQLLRSRAPHKPWLFLLFSPLQPQDRTRPQVCHCLLHTG